MGNLKLFIRKDWMVIRKYKWFFLLYLLIYSTLDSSNFLLTIVPATMIIFVSNSDLRPFHKYLGSLPLSRIGMVFGKYVSSGFYMMVGMALAALFYLGGSYIRGTDPEMQNAILTFLTLSIFMAVYYPLYYWLGSKGGHLLLSFSWLIILGATMGIFTSDIEVFRRMELFLNSGAGYVFTIALIGIFLVPSFHLSVAIFRRKDF